MKAPPFNAHDYVRSGLSLDEITDIHELFKLFDVDRSGTVLVKELRSTLLNISLDDQNPALYRLIGQMEALNDSFRLDFHSFLNLMTERVYEAGQFTTMKEAARLFKLFDSDNKGAISLPNLERVARAAGESISTSELAEMIGRADSDGDGQVTLADFYTILNKRIY